MKHQGLIALIFVFIALASFGVGLNLHKPKHKEIVTVDIKQLIGNLAKSEKYRGVSDDEFKRISSNYITYLDSLLLKLSEQENLIIMPKAAIIAGSIDITEQVKQLIDEKEYEGYRDENLQ